MALTDKLTAIANAIRAKSGSTAKLGLADMVTEIGKLWKPSSPTAAAGDVLSGKSFVNSSGTLTNGSMTNRGAVTQTLAANGSYTIPAGFHNGSGKVTQSLTTKAATTYSPKTTAQTIAAGTYLSGTQTIAATTGTAAVANVLKGKTFNSANGIGLTGTMTDNGAVSQSLAINGSYTIPAGYHNGSGKVTQSVTTKAAATYGAKTSAQTIPAGQYLSGAQTIAAVTQTNLSAENIVAGKTVTIASNGSNLWSVTGAAVTSCSNTHTLDINQTYTINCGFRPEKIVVVIKYYGQTIVLEYDNSNPNVLIESTLGSRTEQNNNTYSVRIKTTENGFTYWTSNYAYVGYHWISYAMR